MPSCPTDPLKPEILAAIAAHVAVYGRANWDLIRDNPKYAHVIGGESGKRKFYRWVNLVCDPTPADSQPIRKRKPTDETTEGLGAAKQRALLAAQKNLPVAPSPAYLMRQGAGAEKSINFLAMVTRLAADGEKLRATAVKEDLTADDGEKITNAFMFEKSITARLRVMETALRVMQEIWDLQYQQRFYDAITSIIVEELSEFPEIQLRVIERLEVLNNQRGMTLHAEPG